MNWPNTIFAGQRIAVVGLGRNGLPAAQTLEAMGAEVIAWDDSAVARDSAARGGLTVAEPDMDATDLLVLSPGIPHRLPRAHPLAARALGAGVPVLSDADLLYRAARAAGSKARFAGITGTNGKSTTTALLGHILDTAGIKTAAGGNLGTASLALPLLPDDGVYVLEMSSYMLERIAELRFDVAGMLNLSADHLDRHGDMAGYALAKRAIFDRQTARDVAVVGIDDDWSREMVQALRARPARVMTISAERPAHTGADIWAEGNVLRDANGVIADLTHARALRGAHNAQNAAMAVAMARALGVSDDAIRAGLVAYPGLPHRLEQVGSFGGVSFVNDSKATNADSTARALACYDKVIWIAGGEAKAGGIESLSQFFPRIAEALLIGRDAKVLARTLSAHGVRWREVGTLEAAVEASWRDARDGLADVVLLSPACASWDQFTGFDQRGDMFRTLVQELVRSHEGAA